MTLISVPPGSFLENIHNSPNSIAGIGNYVGGNIQNYDEKQVQLMSKMMESMIALNERVISLLEKGTKNV